MSRRSPELAARIRRTIIDMAKRRQRPGTGSGSLKPNETHRLQWPDLTDVLSDIPWAVAGGVATRRYMRERQTDDLDIVILPQHERRAEDHVLAAGYRKEGPLAIGGSRWRSPAGVAVDLIPLTEPWAETALGEAARNLGTDRMPVLTLPFLTMMKLNAMRGIDMGDITRMFAAASDEQREEVMSVVRRWQPDQADDVQSLIEMGKLEANEL